MCVIGFLTSLGLNFKTQNNNNALHVIHTVNIIRDTVSFTKSKQVSSKYFNNVNDIILFVRYIKTQSHGLNMDNWAVMKTIFNRMDDYRCTWREYYDYKRYNHSESISKMKHNPNKVKFNFNIKGDRELFFRAIDASLGNYPEEIKENIPSNILYFESFPKIWNLNKPKMGIFNRDSIQVEYKHEFYRGKLKKN
jgi:hypothetical protein